MVTKTIRVQTEQKLFEKVNAIKSRAREAETQTAVELKRTLPVYFLPRATGAEIATQIEEDELFDFDTEVEPILQVIVGRTIQTSVLELSEEFELLQARMRQDSYEKIRQAEIMEARRLEAADMRRQEEKKRRIQQERSRLEITRIALEKTMSVKIAKDMFSTLCFDACKELGLKGFFRDPVIVEFEQIYVPNLIREAIALHEATEKRLDEICEYIFEEPVKMEDQKMKEVMEERAKKAEVDNVMHAIISELHRLQQPYVDGNTSIS
jgi:hypothetical protein